MKVSQALQGGLLVFILTGCASSDLEPEAIEPISGMTVDQAGIYYLRSVCPSNAQRSKFNERSIAWGTSEAELGANDRALLTQTAETLRDAARRLEAPPDSWPGRSGLEEEIAEVAQMLRHEASLRQQASEAATQAEAHAIAFGITAESFRTRAPAGYVRVVLGLPSSDGEDNGCGPYESFTD